MAYMFMENGTLISSGTTASALGRFGWSVDKLGYK
jgi:hypothetical protein